MFSVKTNKKMLVVVSNTIYCDALAGMSLELINIRVHRDNGFINYCVSGRFKPVPIRRYNCEELRHSNLLAWMHNLSDPGQRDCL